MKTVTPLACYQELVGEHFTVIQTDAESGTLRLEEVGVHANDRARIDCSLYFQAAPPLRAQGIYDLTHPVLGENDIFLVPARKATTGFVYEAVFNTIPVPETLSTREDSQNTNQNYV
jgi:hypothetical protein